MYKAKLKMWSPLAPDLCCKGCREVIHSHSSRALSYTDLAPYITRKWKSWNYCWRDSLGIQEQYLSRWRNSGSASVLWSNILKIKNSVCRQSRLPLKESSPYADSALGKDFLQFISALPVWSGRFKHAFNTTSGLGAMITAFIVSTL